MPIIEKAHSEKSAKAVSDKSASSLSNSDNFMDAMNKQTS